MLAEPGFLDANSVAGLDNLGHCAPLKALEVLLMARVRLMSYGFG